MCIEKGIQCYCLFVYPPEMFCDPWAYTHTRFQMYSIESIVFVEIQCWLGSPQGHFLTGSQVAVDSASDRLTKGPEGCQQPGARSEQRARLCQELRERVPLFPVCLSAAVSQQWGFCATYLKKGQVNGCAACICSYLSICSLATLCSIIQRAWVWLIHSRESGCWPSSHPGLYNLH